MPIHLYLFNKIDQIFTIINFEGIVFLKFLAKNHQGKLAGKSLLDIEREFLLENHFLLKFQKKKELLLVVLIQNILIVLDSLKGTYTIALLLFFTKWFSLLEIFFFF